MNVGALRTRAYGSYRPELAVQSSSKKRQQRTFSRPLGVRKPPPAERTDAVKAQQLMPVIATVEVFVNEISGTLISTPSIETRGICTVKWSPDRRGLVTNCS